MSEASCMCAGYDHCRDGLNTPAFLGMLLEVDGLAGLAVGYGEGHNVMLLGVDGRHEGYR